MWQTSWGNIQHQVLWGKYQQTPSKEKGVLNKLPFLYLGKWKLWIELILYGKMKRNSMITRWKFRWRKCKKEFQLYKTEKQSTIGKRRKHSITFVLYVEKKIKRKWNQWNKMRHYTNRIWLIMQISVSKVRIKHYQSTNLILIRRNKKPHIGLKPS